MQPAQANHYTTLGLDRRCTAAQIRAAYRLLAKRHHPDLNPGSSEAVRRTQALVAAHQVLSDPERRRNYDSELDVSKKSPPRPRAVKLDRNISQDVNLRLEELLGGTSRQVRITDPGNPQGPELYELTIPPGTAPGTRFRLPRVGPLAGGFVQLRARALPSFRFKVRGSDLRCDLKLRLQRATQGGTEWIRGVTGAALRVEVPLGVARGEIVRLSGEGLPKPRGGRGDLLVRITYRPEVRIARPAGR